MSAKEIWRTVKEKRTVVIRVAVYDNASVTDVERAISAGLDANGIECIYDVKEETKE